MTDEIRVKVASHGANRNSPNLLMYYVDPVTEKRVTRSTGTTDRREAERAAGLGALFLCGRQGKGATPSPQS